MLDLKEVLANRLLQSAEQEDSTHPASDNEFLKLIVDSPARQLASGESNQDVPSTSNSEAE